MREVSDLIQVLDWSGARPVDKGEEREGEAGPGREGLSGLHQRGGLKLD